MKKLCHINGCDGIIESVKVEFDGELVCDDNGNIEMVDRCDTCHKPAASAVCYGHFRKTSKFCMTVCKYRIKCAKMSCIEAQADVADDIKSQYENGKISFAEYSQARLMISRQHSIARGSTKSKPRVDMRDILEKQSARPSKASENPRNRGAMAKGDPDAYKDL
jgi:hypothetical protein